MSASVSGRRPTSVGPELVDEPIPEEILDTLVGVGLGAGGANVIMQLSRLPVGHGVAKSTVESGRVDAHPVKRLRTTTAFLVIALLGTAEERLALRREINRAHAQVRSAPGDAVSYDAFDVDLQLWVAACLYKGVEDGYLLMHGDRADESVLDDVLYPHCARFATTLQVPPERWPATRADFHTYWENGLREIRMDDVTRPYLQGIAQLTFLTEPLGRVGRPLRPLLRPMGEFMTLGCLPEPFRRELDLPWAPWQQRVWDWLVRTLSPVVMALPRPIRMFPLNLYLADTRRRLRTGRRVV